MVALISTTIDLSFDTSDFVHAFAFYLPIIKAQKIIVGIYMQTSVPHHWTLLPTSKEVIARSVLSYQLIYPTTMHIFSSTHFHLKFFNPGLITCLELVRSITYNSMDLGKLFKVFLPKNVQNNFFLLSK